MRLSLMHPTLQAEYIFTDCKYIRPLAGLEMLRLLRTPFDELRARVCGDKEDDC